VERRGFIWLFREGAVGQGLEGFGSNLGREEGNGRWCGGQSGGETFGRRFNKDEIGETTLFRFDRPASHTTYTTHHDTSIPFKAPAPRSQACGP